MRKIRPKTVQKYLHEQGNGAISPRERLGAAEAGGAREAGGMEHGFHRSEDSEEEDLYLRNHFGESQDPGRLRTGSVLHRRAGAYRLTEGGTGVWQAGYDYDRPGPAIHEPCIF